MNPAPTNNIAGLYQSLRQKHGPPSGQWELWCRRPKTSAEKERVALEAILTQRAAWYNVQRAVSNLQSAGCLGLEPVRKAGSEELEVLIRPAGFYRQKAARLQILACFLLDECGGMDAAGQRPAAQLRRQLLALPGVGPETADDILLYGLEKPVFVIDEYTRRLARRLRLTDNFAYHHLQTLFTQNLPPDYRLYQDFHALVVIDGKEPL